MHLRTLQEVGLRFAAGTRSDAEMVVGRLEQLGSPGFEERLHVALETAGQHYLCAVSNPTPPVESIDLDARIGDFDRATRKTLEIARGLDEARSLSWPEHRRVDELRNLLGSMQRRWWSARWVLAKPEVLRRYMRVAATLGGFDTAVIAAQAGGVLDELEVDDDADDILSDEPSVRSLSQWDHVPDAARLIDEIVDIFPRVPRQCARPLAAALASAPPKTYVHEKVMACYPTMRRSWRLEAALVGLSTSLEPVALALTWSVDEDVRLRQAATFVVGWALENEPSAGLRLALTALDDADRGVQAQAVDLIADEVEQGLVIDAALSEVLVRLETEPQRPYLCIWCDSLVAAKNVACPACETSAPSFQEHLRRALGKPRRSVGTDELRELFGGRGPRRRVRQNGE